jgi:ABC-type glycerol-3-phosphate transport system substrate-binding protein
MRLPAGSKIAACGLCLLACAAAGPDVRADTVSPDGRIHVTYWDKWISGYEGTAIETAVAAFNHSQDRIVVDYFITSQIDRKTIIATAGGDPPDVAGLWAQNVSTFADAEALTPLDGFIERDGMTKEQWLSRYYPVFARICQHGGHVYAGISTPATMALYWNKTMFREAGLDPDRPPRTLAEFNDDCRKLTKRDPKTGALVQVGFLPQEPGWWPWAFCCWFGGSMFDGRSVTLATNPHNLEAMRWMQSFTSENGLDDVKTFSSYFGPWASPTAPFFTGKLAMVIQGVWYDGYIAQYKPGLDFGVGPWPEAVPGVPDFAMAEADILTIPRGARNPRAAWEFIRYINSCNPGARTREELKGAELLDFLQEKLSPLREWSPYFEQHHPNTHIAVFRHLAESPHIVCIPDMGTWWEYYREILSAFDKVRLLEATPEQALAYSQKRLDESWARYRLSLERHGQTVVSGTANPP